MNNKDNFYYYFIKKILKGDIDNESFKYLKKNKNFIIHNNFFNHEEKKFILNILKSKNFFLFLTQTKYLRKIITSNKNISFLNEIKRIFFRIKLIFNSVQVTYWVKPDIRTHTFYYL